MGKKGQNLDAYELVERIAAYAQMIESERYLMNSNLTLLNDQIYIENHIIDLSILYATYLEKTLHLSNGIKTLLESKDEGVKSMFELFAQETIQEEIKSELYSHLRKQKAFHRSKQDMAHSTEQLAQRLIIQKVQFACLNSILTTDDLNFWLSLPNCENWLKITELTAKAAKNHVYPNKSQLHYKPWIVLVRERLLKVEQENAAGIFTDLDRKIVKVIKWIFKKQRRELLNWLLPFLFNERWADPKRKFLYVTGPPNSGKTFLVNVLFPRKYFQILNRTFAHFGSESSGEYDLHLLLFDDPGEAKNKSNQLDTSAILNLANYNPSSITHSLPVKFGFMSFKKGQIAIISNQPYQKLFAQKDCEAIKTRLYTVRLQKRDFPLKLMTCASEPVVFKEISFDEHGNMSLEEEDDEDFLGKEEDEDDEEEDDFLNEEEKEEVENEDVMFYILWRGILKLLKAQLENLSLAKLQKYIPNKTLCTLIRDKKFDSIYNIICHEIHDDKKLLEYVL